MCQGRKTARRDFLGYRALSRPPVPPEPPHSWDPEPEPSEGLNEVRGFACLPLGEEHPQAEGTTSLRPH